MPCFKGIAVSIHANSSPLPEYGMQRQSRFSRVSTYIPVPQPQISADSNKPEPARFAISITLLTPGLAIPYSVPKATDDNPKPKPQFVGSLPTPGSERGKFNGVVMPYVPMTNSENETIAAYIYFDGRAKEEVATLLRPGEETWVNSRWVQVPESEGGGLAEREFLFKEVGLERWLNGLDLQGHDAAEKLERRRQKFERRRRRQRADTAGTNGARDALRYGAEDGAPLEPVLDESDYLSDDDPPEATGQIKVAMFRVLASGEIKKGEYSPQFGAHDDDEDEMGNRNNKDDNINADVEHTTSFAKPKTLDPSTISTQTVTGIDGPDKPYATFTFFYRGERQLQKIGVLASSKNAQAAGSSKRRSGQLDFSNLGPLKTSGTVGFSAFRDGGEDAVRRRKARKKSNGNASGNPDDSEDDEDESAILDKMKDIEDKDVSASLSPEDANFQGELADGVGRMRLKRAHSADPDSLAAGKTPESGDMASSLPSANRLGGPSAGSPEPPSLSGGLLDPSIVGSPMKRQRPSVSAETSDLRPGAIGSGVGGMDNVLSSIGATQQKQAPQAPPEQTMEEEEL